MKRAGQVATIAFLLLAVAPATMGQTGPADVAVLDFDTEPIARSWSYPWDRAAIGRVASDMLSRALDAHPGLQAIDRNRVRDFADQSVIDHDGSNHREIAAGIRRALGAEFVVFGTITRFSHQEKEYGSKELLDSGGEVLDGVDALLGDHVDERMRLWKFRKKVAVGAAVDVKLTKANVRAKLEARIVNAATGDTVASFASEGEIKFGSKSVGAFILGSGFDEEQVAKILDAVVAKLATAIRNDPRCIEPVPACLKGSVVMDRDGAVYLNLGSDAGAQEGTFFEIRRPGEALTDPETGEILAIDETRVGRVEVIEVRGAKLSIAQIREGTGFKRGDRAVQIAAPGQQLACNVLISQPSLAAAAATRADGTGPARPASPPQAAPPRSNAATAVGATRETPDASASASGATPTPASRPVVDRFAAAAEATDSAVSVVREGNFVGRWVVDNRAAARHIYDLAVEANPLLAEMIRPDHADWDSAADQFEKANVQADIRSNGTFTVRLGPAEAQPRLVFDGFWKRQDRRLLLEASAMNGGQLSEPMRQAFAYVSGKLVGEPNDPVNEPGHNPSPFVWPVLVLVRAGS